MTSDRKIASNRKNAQNSTGPRSERGRHHSSRNALRHGLAIAIGSDPSFSKDIEALATALARGGGAIAGELARQVAEAEFELQRIRNLKAARFNAVLGNPDARFGDYFELSESLAQLERYERRAFSRRKRALLAMSGTQGETFNPPKLANIRSDDEQNCIWIEVL